MLGGQWAGIVWPASPEAEYDPETGVGRETLVRVGRASVDVPVGFVSLFIFLLCDVIGWTDGVGVGDAWED